MQRTILRLLQPRSGAAVLLIIVALMAVGATAPRAVEATIDPQVYADLTAAPDGLANFVLYFGRPPDLSGAAAIADWGARGRLVAGRLQASAVASQAPVLATLNQRGPGRIAGYRSLWIANAIVVRGDRAAAEALAREPGVVAILPELKVAPLPVDDEPASPVQSLPAAAPAAVEWGVQKIGAPAVWAAPYNATGQGVVIGLVDTGVEWDHAALKPHYRGWDSTTSTVNHDYNWYNPEPAATCSDAATGTCDYWGHGTHVTGTTVGDDGLGNQIGVAPGARWIHALGCCPDNAALLAALQWMLAPTDRNGFNPDPNQRPHVVSNSWGGPGGSRIFEDAIANLAAAGIVPVFSAGNNGPACGSLGSPGDNLPAFNVGATSSSDYIANFSSRGSNAFSGQTGPAVSAPGESVRSSTRGGGFGAMSGTSMAAPHVAGAVALILSAEPDLIGRVEQVEELLRRTAAPLTAGVQTCGGVPGTAVPNNTYGWGRIDVAAAVHLVWQAGTLAGTVTAASTGQPLAGALVSISRDGDTLTQRTSAGGAYSFVAGAGKYQVLAEAFGYASQTVTGVVVGQDTAAAQDFALGNLAAGSISGMVLENGTAAPIRGATVAVDGAALSAVTAADGAYTLAGVPFGAHTVRVTSPGYRTVRAGVAVDGAETLDFAPAAVADYVVGDGGDTCSARYAWIDATGGTAHALDDDAFVEVALPWAFTFYGNDYGTAYLSANGFISFGQGYAKWHGIVPFEGAPNNQIIGLGEDLNPAGGAQGRIYTADLGDGRFVIEYHAVEHWASGSPETFEIILDNNDDTITVQYHTVSWPDFANAGIENADGSRGILYSQKNQPPLRAGLAVKYTPFRGQAPACLASVYLPLILAAR